MRIQNNDGKPHQNLHIKKLIHKGKSVGEEFQLKPKDSIVFMTENVSLENNQIGFLFEKKSGWENGLMLNCTKLVHPDYEGPLSGLITNISNRNHLIHKDDKILELVIINEESQFNKFPKKPKTTDEYEKNLKKISIKFPNSFININELKKSFTNLRIEINTSDVLSLGL